MEQNEPVDIPFENEVEAQDFKNYKEWIEKFKIESWQPELVVSGVAIFATVQLPDLIRSFFEISSTNAEGIFRYALFLIGIYLLIVSFALMANFLFHFILRTFWIGMVGLMAAYPTGIIFDKITSVSPYFLEQYQKRLKSISHFTWRLDRFCSAIFSFSFMSILAILGSIIIVLLGLVITYLMLKIVPDLSFKSQLIVLLIVLSVLALPSMLGSLSLVPGIKNNKRINKYLFLSYWYGNPMFAFLVVKPFHYVSLTFASNLNFKRYAFVIFLYFFFLMMGFYAYDRFNPITSSLNSIQVETNRDFYSHSSFEHSMIHAMYDNLRAENQMIPLASIQSDMITDDYIRLFVHYHKNEDQWLKKMCVTQAEFEPADSLSRYEKASLRDQNALQCFQTYLSIQIDGQEQNNVEWLFHTHPNKGEQGVITYIPIANKAAGKHVISIKKHVPKEEKNPPRNIDIPFWIGS